MVIGIQQKLLLTGKFTAAPFFLLRFGIFRFDKEKGFWGNHFIFIFFGVSGDFHRTARVEISGKASEIYLFDPRQQFVD